MASKENSRVEVKNVRSAYGSLCRLLPVISFARRSDIDKYLKMYNVNLESGKFRCAICGDIVTRENIYALIVNGSSIKVICNKPSCQARLTINTPYYAR
jgi:hypothetical protein